jgi:hypothetical protein
MKTKPVLSLIFLCSASLVFAQGQDYAINTLLKKGAHHASGGYGAITNKFTTINGHHANIVEVYGGWYINHRFLLGFAAAGVTNNIPVLPQFSAKPGTPLSYEYGQVGLMTEYVIGSEKAVHLAFQLFAGTGFTMQYERHPLESDFGDNHAHDALDEDYFFVAEPGVKLEMNIFKWMRFSPGISYRAAFNSNAMGLSDNALSAMSYNLTLKFGKF